MNYLRKRLGQTSTWIGIAVAVSALIQSHGAITPEITSELLSALGLVHIDEDKVN